MGDWPLGHRLGYPIPPNRKTAARRSLNGVAVKQTPSGCSTQILWHWWNQLSAVKWSGRAHARPLLHSNSLWMGGKGALGSPVLAISRGPTPQKVMHVFGLKRPKLANVLKRAMTTSVCAKFIKQLGLLMISCNVYRYEGDRKDALWRFIQTAAKEQEALPVKQSTEG